MTGPSGGSAPLPGPGTGGAPQPTPTPAPTPTRLPDTLVGNWGLAGTGDANYYNPATRLWSNPSDDGDAWTFTPDGRFTHATVLHWLIWNCETRIFALDEGAVTADGARLTFRSGRSTSTGTYSCQPSDDYETAVPGKTGTFDYALGAEGGRPRLSVTWADGAKSFRKR